MEAFQRGLLDPLPTFERAKALAGAVAAPSGASDPVAQAEMADFMSFMGQVGMASGR